LASDVQNFRLPDGSYPPPTWQASVYLFTRPFIVAWAFAGFVGALALLVAPAIRAGNVDGGTLVTAVPISAICGFGFAALFGLWGFMAKCALTRPKPARGDESEAVTSLKANHLAGDEGRGGTLYVSIAGVEFVPHRFNFQPGNVWMPHSAISELAWSNVLNRTGARLATMMHITTAAGAEHFIVADTFPDALGEIAARAEVPAIR
jgi:hypothetical protein